MKVNTKLLRTTLLGLALLLPIPLWITRPEWKNSLSSFHGTEMDVFYILMHVSIIQALWAYFAKYRENLYFWLAVGMSFVLGFNMYGFYTLHVIATLISMALGLFTIVYVSRTTRERNLRLFLIVPTIIFTVISYIFPSVHFLVGEWAIMAMVSFGLIRQDYLKR